MLSPKRCCIELAGGLRLLCYTQKPICTQATIGHFWYLVFFPQSFFLPFYYFFFSLFLYVDRMQTCFYPAASSSIVLQSVLYRQCFSVQSKTKRKKRWEIVVRWLSLGGRRDVTAGEPTRWSVSWQRGQHFRFLFNPCWVFQPPVRSRSHWVRSSSRSNLQTWR